MRHYPRKQYVVLGEAPVAAHKVQRWGSVAEGAQQLPMTMDIYSLLVPAATARRLLVKGDSMRKFSLILDSFDVNANANSLLGSKVLMAFVKCSTGLL